MEQRFNSVSVTVYEGSEQLVVWINWTVFCYRGCVYDRERGVGVVGGCCSVAQCSVMQNTETVIKQKGKNKPPWLQPGTPAISHLTGLQFLARHQGFTMQIAVASWEYGKPLVKDTDLRGLSFRKCHRAMQHEESPEQSWVVWQTGETDDMKSCDPFSFAANCMKCCKV